MLMGRKPTHSNIRTCILNKSNHSCSNNESTRHRVSLNLHDVFVFCTSNSQKFLKTFFKAISYMFACVCVCVLLRLVWIYVCI